MYGREGPGEEPHPAALKVIKLVVDQGLQVMMSTRRDFSDVVAGDGSARPREPSR